MHNRSKMVVFTGFKKKILIDLEKKELHEKLEEIAIKPKVMEFTFK